MSKKVFTCVLIGLGDIGLNYDLFLNQEKYIKTHANAFFSNPGFDLQGGVDIDTDACDKFKNKYSTQSYNLIEDALLENIPDLIILSVPTSFQLDAIKKIVACYKPKAILCEKPMGENLEQGKEIVNLCNKLGIGLYVNFIRRCLPESKEVKNRIDNSIIKPPMRSVIWYSKGLIHNGSHFINLMEYWFGECLDVQIINEGRFLKNFGAEPQVFLKFNNCELTLIPAWEEFYSHYTIELVSSTGRLYWGQHRLEWTKAEDDSNQKSNSYLAEKTEELLLGSNRYQKYVADELHLAMSGQNSSISSGHQALETLRTIDRIESLR